MSIKDSSLFEQPLDFVHHVKEGKHIVLFYEELEYANMISYQFIKSGLEHKKDCSYLSEEELEVVKREMVDSGIGVKKFTRNEQLHIYQVPSLTDYVENAQLKEIEQGEERTATADTILRNLSEIRQSGRIVLRCIYKINTEEQIKSNLKWEHDYHFKDLKNSGVTVVCTYPINDIIPTLSDSKGCYGKWMNDLLEIYDGVIFARRFWKGVALNLA
jgi:hypothetical protein